MNNLEFYKEEIKERYSILTKMTEHKYGRYDLADAIYEVCWDKKGKKHILDWLCEEHQILDKEEKEYLSNVIRPFKDRVTCIVKSSNNIHVVYDDGWDEFKLPSFKQGAMYKGMEVNKKYTLKELGL